MKKHRPTMLTISLEQEDIYMKPLTPQDQNGNKLVTPHAITKITRDILDTSIVPLTPMTPYTPIWKGDDLFFNPELKEYCFYHSVHTLVRPVKYSAPKEAPPPPNEIELAVVYAMTLKDNSYVVPCDVRSEYAIPLQEENNIYDMPADIESYNAECIALITDLFAYLD